MKVFMSLQLLESILTGFEVIAVMVSALIINNFIENNTTKGLCPYSVFSGRTALAGRRHEGYAAPYVR